MASALRADLQLHLEQQGQHQTSSFNIDVDSDKKDFFETLHGRYGHCPKFLRYLGFFNLFLRFHKFLTQWHTRNSKSKQKKLFFGYGSPDYFVLENKWKPIEVVDHFRNRLKLKIHHDILLVRLIDYIVEKNAGNVSPPCSASTTHWAQWIW